MALLKKLSKKAQAGLEYVIVLSVISSALLLGADQYIRPAVMELLEKAGEMIEREADRLTRHYE